uniref:MYND-type domain-containing protein n=1 Tax=Entomoneis paludosa TaxID=265537 RepID=A0A7S3DVM0_9STRA|mmetsp:Transcript_40355/g.83995  ORF Transcript_40355/g.83995 Transcript_40355/m.83995 type:complete len:183 (+) Transcript_40355:103-651(+)|eukprot:CAMPEP_0172440220 /NCGR_PEP_ID=MMETSP1065-20121228/925_1 /TAXON_ID=265537 /ORGANISM="Amphiprora paludosa, Strain CCMP125" /LENGTH=182 /DNA_ID=CAMNT_0013189005 /DNA_START=88 /DNA_END=636 /DNA_ORIENTATION=-
MSDPASTTENDAAKPRPNPPTVAETMAASTGACRVCGAAAAKKCSRCKAVFYCCVEHQKSDWKRHKPSCNDTFQADQYTLHKREFDRIIQKYKLDTDQASSDIAEFLTKSSTEGSMDQKVSAAEFSKKFGTTEAEAVVFLEWIKVGVKFKQDSIDIANKSGFAGVTAALPAAKKSGKKKNRK